MQAADVRPRTSAARGESAAVRIGTNLDDVRTAAPLAALVLLSGCPLHVVIDQGGVAPAPVTAARHTCTSEIAGACGTEFVLTAIVEYMTLFAELCGAIIIAAAVVRAILAVLPRLVRGPTNDHYQEEIRLQLGKSLALALEFELGADILKTAVAPTLAVIAQLAAITVLRTMLNYFLERELRHAESRGARQGDPAPS